MSAGAALSFLGFICFGQRAATLGAAAGPPPRAVTVHTRGAIPDEIRKKVLLWVGCIAGALEENEYTSKLQAAGFEQIEVEPTRVYKVEDAREFLSSAGVDVDSLAPQVHEKFMSAFVRAVKPAKPETRACCGPTCCQ